jgi:peroxiredoxin Q/BCP
MIKRNVNGKTELLKNGVVTPRWTFVIDKEGKIALKNTKVNPSKDSKAVMSQVESLK